MKSNKNLSQALGIIATLFSIVAFVPYNLKGFAGDTKPNASSWLVWAFITFLNFTSYREVTDERKKGDWSKSLLPTADSLMCFVTAIVAIYIGSLKSLNKIEWLCLVLGVVAGLCWRIFKSASFAQIILQVALVVGGIPTLISVWHSPSIEPWLSWLLWTISFVIQFFAVKVNWGGKRIEFLYPVCMTLFHGAVFVLAVK